MTTNRRNKQDRRGTAMVEMALVLPIFLMLVLGIIEFGRAMMIANLVTNAAREGARVACVSRSEENARRTSDEINGLRADAAKPYAVDVADHAAAGTLHPPGVFDREGRNEKPCGGHYAHRQHERAWSSAKPGSGFGEAHVYAGCTHDSPPMRFPDALPVERRRLDQDPRTVDEAVPSDPTPSRPAAPHIQRPKQRKTMTALPLR